MSLRTRLALSATPAVAWTAQNALAGVSASGVAGEPSVTVPFVVKPDSLQTVLSLSAVPGWSTQRTRTMIGASAAGVLGYPSVIWSSAIPMPSNASAGVTGNLYLEIDGATTAPGIYGTGGAGSITVNDTVWGSADLEGVVGTEGAGTIAVTGYGTVNVTGPQIAGGIGSVFVGEAFTVAAATAIGTAGTVSGSGGGSAVPVGAASIGWAGSVDFDSRLLLRVIRITARMETT